MTSPPPPALVVIPFSHYCAYSRLALDFARVQYRTVSVLPLLHMAPVAWLLWRAGVRGTSSKTGSPLATPLLQLQPAPAGGASPAVLQGSALIAAWARQHAAPGARAVAEASGAAAALAVAAHETLGPAVRRYAYSSILYSARQFLAVGVLNAGGVLSALLWVLLSPLLALALRAALRVDPAQCERDAARMRAVFADASALLADGRPFLAGAALSDADLAWAGLASPAIYLTREQGGYATLPPESSFPSDMRALFAELRETPAGRHVVKVFQLARADRA